MRSSPDSGSLTQRWARLRLTGREGDLLDAVVVAKGTMLWYVSHMEGTGVFGLIMEELKEPSDDPDEMDERELRLESPERWKPSRSLDS